MTPAEAREQISINLDEVVRSLDMKVADYFAGRPLDNPYAAEAYGRRGSLTLLELVTKAEASDVETSISDDFELLAEVDCGERLNVLWTIYHLL